MLEAKRVWTKWNMGVALDTQRCQASPACIKLIVHVGLFVLTLDASQVDVANGYQQHGREDSWLHRVRPLLAD